MNPEPLFSVGQTVWRIENRDQTQATILEILSYDEMMGGYSYLIGYVEGGQGYWTQDCLSATPYPAV